LPESSAADVVTMVTAQDAAVHAVGLNNRVQRCGTDDPYTQDGTFRLADEYSE